MYEWDDRKNHANRHKHGIDFADAARIFEASVPVFEAEDRRRNYGEPRIRAIGMCAEDLLYVVYTPRGDTRRIISARRASRAEERLYHTHLQRRTQTSGEPD